MLGVAPHQMRAHGVHRALGAARLRRSRNHGPRLRQRIELALLVLHRSQRRAVVEVRAAIPVAVPRQLEHAGEPPRLVAVLARQIGAAAALADRREVVQHGHEEPAEPHALAAALVADAVHAVVPVAGADQRQPVRTVLRRVRDRAHGSARRASPSRTTRAAGGRSPSWPGSSSGASRNGTTSSSTDSSPVAET